MEPAVSRATTSARTSCSGPDAAPPPSELLLRPDGGERPIAASGGWLEPGRVLEVIEADARRVRTQLPSQRTPRHIASEVAAIQAQLEPIVSVEALAGSFAREAGLAGALVAAQSPLREAYAHRYLALVPNPRAPMRIAGRLR